MPGFDQTGPAGAGRLSGRGMGPCGGGFGYGRRGGGFGYGRFGGGYPSQPRLTKEEETEMLQKDLEEIKGRLDELKK